MNGERRALENGDNAATCAKLAEMGWDGSFAVDLSHLWSIPPGAQHIHNSCCAESEVLMTVLIPNSYRAYGRLCSSVVYGLIVEGGNHLWPSRDVPDRKTVGDRGGRRCFIELA